jgi:hypothetical protein
MGNLLPDTLGLLGGACAFALVAGVAFVAIRAYEDFREQWLRDGGAGAALGLRESVLLGLVRKAVLGPVSPINAHFVPKRFYAPVSTLLRRAGYPAEITALEVAGLMELCSLVLGALGALVISALQISPLVVPAAAILGAFYPILWLRDCGKARQHQIARALPYDLDLLTL